MRQAPPVAWVILLTGAAYGLSLAPGLNALPTFDGRLFAIIALVAATALLLASTMQFRLAKTEFMPNSPTNASLVTGGVFALTRNPMYLGMILICLAAAFSLGRWPMQAAPFAFFAVANWVFIPFEEAKMRRQFGDA
ncbi:MAG: methyltransferase family protein, partial [Alphaproteobacteria bacterium]